MPVVHRNGSRYSNEAERRKHRKKGLNNAEAPLSVLLPANVAVQWVIFITNEINNAAICPQLSPGVLHQLEEMRILRCNNKTTPGEGGCEQIKYSKYNECHPGKQSKISTHTQTHIYAHTHTGTKTVKGRSMKKKIRRCDYKHSA